MPSVTVMRTVSTSGRLIVTSAAAMSNANEVSVVPLGHSSASIFFCVCFQSLLKSCTFLMLQSLSISAGGSLSGVRHLTKVLQYLGPLKSMIETIDSVPEASKELVNDFANDTVFSQ